MANQPPETLLLAGKTTIEAADGESGPPKITIDLYSGGRMRPRYWGDDVIIELDGIKPRVEPLPILRDHDPSRILGHTTAITKNGKLRMEGVLSAVNAESSEVIESAKKGFPWRASMGADKLKRKWIPEGSSAIANGKTEKGPFWHVSACELYEGTVLSIPADKKSDVTVAAGGQGMDQDTIDGLTDKGEGASGVQSEKTNTTQTPKEVAATAGTATATTEPPESVEASEDARLEAARAEYRKIRNEELANEANIRAAAGGDEKLFLKAMKDGWDVHRTRAESLEAQLAAGDSAPAVHTSKAGGLSTDIVTAAGLRSVGVSDDVIKAEYGEQALEASDSKEFRGIGLVRTIQLAGQAIGKRLPGDTRSEDFVSAAFSTHEITNVLEGVARGSMLNAYRGPEESWRKFCAVGRNDTFHDVNRHQLAGGGSFKRVGNNGSLKAMKLSDRRMTAAVDTDGLTLNLTRKEIINDDMGAFTRLFKTIGRDASMHILRLVSTKLIDSGGAFFTTGNKNYAEGSGTALGPDSIGTQVTAFMRQVGIDGEPLNLTPKYLVVPTAIQETAHRIYKSEKLIATGTGSSRAVEGSDNIHQSKYEPVVLNHLGAEGGLGGIDTAWFLFPDPNDVAAMEVTFLRGIESPQIRRNPDRGGFLSVSWDAWIDVGVNYQQPEAVRKLKGAA